MKELEEVLAKLTPDGIKDFLLFEHILEQIYPNRPFRLGDTRSPIPGHLRDKKSMDRHASFGVYISKDTGRIYWNDQGWTSQTGGGPADLLMAVSDDINDLSTALTYCDKFIQTQESIELDVLKIRATLDAAEVEVPICSYDSNYTESELEFWDNIWITPNQLKWADIYGLREARWGSGYTMESSEDHPRFLYVETWNKDRTPAKLKLYSPYEKLAKLKFKSYNPDNVELWNAMVKMIKATGKKDVLVTSCKKDALVTMRSTRMAALGSAGETNMKGWIARLDDIKKLDLNLIWMYDGDEVGWNASKNMAKEFGGTAIDMRGVFGKYYSTRDNEVRDVKDQSDFLSKKLLAPNGVLAGNTPNDLKNLIFSLL